MSKRVINPSGATANVMILVTAIVVIQVGAAIAKQLFPIISPEGVAALRLFYAAIILSVVWRPWRVKLSSSQFFATLLYGISLGGMNLFIYLAFERLPLGVAIALEFMGPLTIALFASRKILDFFWVFLAIVGLMLLLPIFKVSNTLDPLGVCFALGAGICWALYILFGKNVSLTLHSGIAASLGMVVGALLVLPFGIMKVGMRLFSFELLPAVLAVAILSSVIPYSLEIVVLKRLPVKLFGILQSLGPALGAIAGLVLLNEYLTSTQWFAIICIIIASIGSTLFIDKKEPIIELAQRQLEIN